jgi:hypothetical protein
MNFAWWRPFGPVIRPSDTFSTTASLRGEGTTPPAHAAKFGALQSSFALTRRRPRVF